MDDKWSEYRELMRKFKKCSFFSGKIKLNSSSGQVFVLICHPYDFLVVMDDRKYGSLVLYHGGHL